MTVSVLMLEFDLHCPLVNSVISTVAKRSGETRLGVHLVVSFKLGVPLTDLSPLARLRIPA
jgi:hypothetical protein